MRHYDTTYRDEIRNSIYGVKRHIRDIDYDKPIKSVEVSQEHHFLKDYCIAAASQAHNQVDVLRERTRNAGDLVDKFYKSVEETGASIKFTATKIGELLIEANVSMMRIHSALNETGDYSGKKVNSKIIRNAGVDKAECEKTCKEVWEKITDLQVKKHIISDYVAIRYVENINELLRDGKKLSSKQKDWFDDICEHYLGMFEGKQVMLSSKEKELISTIHSQYVELRFGPLDDCRDLPKNAINNCIVAYEMLNPKAKQITNSFFENVLKENDEEINFSVDCIKYVLYTDEPKYRDVILYYLPLAQLKRIEPGEIDSYGGNTLYLVLTEDHDNRLKNDGAFSHEIGHFIDNYAFDDIEDKNGNKIANYSDSFREQLKTDLREHMQDSLSDLGYGTMEEEDQKAVIDFILSPENTNISTTTDKELYKTYLPDDWSTKQVDAFTDLRDHYGYSEYVYDPTSFEVYEVDRHTGLASSNDEEGIISDIAGGESNNQIGGITGHTLDSKKKIGDKPITSSVIKSADDLHNALVEYNYWFEKNGKLNDHYAHEFFAESFKLRVHGKDLTPTQSVFTKSSDLFDKAYEEIYAKVQAESNK